MWNAQAIFWTRLDKIVHALYIHFTSSSNGCTLAGACRRRRVALGASAGVAATLHTDWVGGEFAVKLEALAGVATAASIGIGAVDPGANAIALGTPVGADRAWAIAPLLLLVVGGSPTVAIGTLVMTMGLWVMLVTGLRM